jgi:hypothetical protein
MRRDRSISAQSESGGGCLMNTITSPVGSSPGPNNFTGANRRKNVAVSAPTHSQDPQPGTTGPNANVGLLVFTMVPRESRGRDHFRGLDRLVLVAPWSRKCSETRSAKQKKAGPRELTNPRRCDQRHDASRR